MHYKHYSTDGWLPEGVGERLIVVRFIYICGIGSCGIQLVATCINSCFPYLDSTIIIFMTTFLHRLIQI